MQKIPDGWEIPDDGEIPDNGEIPEDWEISDNGEIPDIEEIHEEGHGPACGFASKHGLGRNVFLNLFSLKLVLFPRFKVVFFSKLKDFLYSLWVGSWSHVTTLVIPLIWAVILEQWRWMGHKDKSELTEAPAEEQPGQKTKQQRNRRMERREKDKTGHEQQQKRTKAKQYQMKQNKNNPPQNPKKETKSSKLSHKHTETH